MITFMLLLYFVFHRLTHNREPVIVVDGSSCFRKFYGDLDWVCGGQFKEYVDIITRFIDGFARKGIHLNTPSTLYSGISFVVSAN